MVAPDRCAQPSKRLGRRNIEFANTFQYFAGEPARAWSPGGRPASSASGRLKHLDRC
jgi:hypothetical protein